MYKYLVQKYVCSVTHSVVRYLNVNLALVFTSGKTRIKKNLENIVKFKYPKPVCIYNIV